jgi:thioredoxin-like negative regulator of GroEL
MKIFFSFIVFVLFTIGLSAQDIDFIRQLIESEKYSSAEELLIKKTESGEVLPEISFLLVKTYLEQGKPEEAKDFLHQHQLDVNTGSAEPMNQVAYGSYLISSGQIEKAKTLFNSILQDKKNKKNTDLLLAMAEAYIQCENGDAHEALNLLELAGKRDKTNARAEILKGNAYRILHDGSNAYLAYQAALSKEPDNVQAHYLLGKIFLSQDNEELSMQHFRIVLEINPDYAPVLETLYNHYYYTNLAEAKKYLELFIKNSDYSIRNQYRLADMQYLTADYAKAIETAVSILQKEQDNAQPRLYKLLAYSYAGLADSVKAFQYLENYFSKEKTERFISRDFEFRARLFMTNPETIQNAAENFIVAFKMDSLTGRKANYAGIIADIFGKLQNYSFQAEWLGEYYRLNKDKTNVDLFNWGLAHYKAQEFDHADSVFARYSEKYPENIYGYYWRAQVNAAIDTSLALGLAVPHYEKVVELGELNTESNKAMLLKAYGYLGGYEANINKDYEKSISYFEKFLELEPSNADANRYIGLLKKWVADERISRQN